MKKVEIVIVIIAILIVAISGTSAGFAIPIVQATPDDSNNQQASDDSNNQQASDDSNDVITFEGDLLPQQSPSNEKVIQFEEISNETITESGDLQNPSIQSQVNQSQPLSQKDVQLPQPEVKPKYDWEHTNGKGCSWNDPLPGWPRHWICTDLETRLAWDSYNRTNDGEKARQFIPGFQPLQPLG
jgi:FtsZ-interacting cell division protein ZipA